MAIGRAADLFDAEVTLQLPGGALRLRWAGPGQNLWMTGPAAVAFRGELPRWSE
jgi:diaminopimelate epimerase